MNEDLIINIYRDPEALGQVVGAIIGVAGLFVGTFITIITSFIIRHMDVKREERRERAEVDRAKKEKEFNLKQNIYSEFISELAALEAFITKASAGSNLKTLENFDNEWTKTEIKVDLVASEQVKNLKDELSDVLLEMAKKKFAQKTPQSMKLSESYTTNRSALLEAIRDDMEITTQTT